MVTCHAPPPPYPQEQREWDQGFLADETRCHTVTLSLVTETHRLTSQKRKERNGELGTIFSPSPHTVHRLITFISFSTTWLTLGVHLFILHAQDVPGQLIRV